LKIIFFGTPKESAKCLEALSEKFDVIFVFTKKDQVRNRGNLKTYTPVKKTAIDLNINFSTSVPNYEDIKILKPDLIILCSYGNILDIDVITSSKYGALNIHPSLLPKYRGASPIVTALLDGCKETGVSIMKMDKGLDTGPILTQKSIKILSNDNAETLTQKLFKEGIKLLIDTIDKINTSEYFEIPQDNNNATLTKLIKKSDGKINWTKKAKKIEREIRAYYPWPMAYSFWNEKNIKIIQAKLSQHIFEKPGYVKKTEDNKIVVATQQGSLELNLVQLEGKTPTNIQDFVNGRPEFIGTILK
tara:strand:+ start:400 stop:1308 length:909 start_codon:yes stop_codon:yes gene_type:complete